MTFRKVLRAKIHGATVTHADLEYEGSLTIPPALMKVADIREYEAVNVWNITRGTRLETYAITGETGTWDITANGAAAHLVSPDDKIIIACFAGIAEEKLSSFRPSLIFVDENNRPIERSSEVPGPKLLHS